MILGLLLVEWEGFPNKIDFTWEAWKKDISSNAKIHDYLAKNQLKRFIPVSFKVQ